MAIGTLLIDNDHSTWSNGTFCIGIIRFQSLIQMIKKCSLNHSTLSLYSQPEFTLSDDIHGNHSIYFHHVNFPVRLKNIGFIALAMVCPLFTLAQSNLGINTTSPHASAILDITSTTKGLLIPRMTLAQRNLITSPATGLLVFQTDTKAGFYFYTGSSWHLLGPTLLRLQDADMDTKIQVEESLDEDVIRMDLAGTEHFVLRKNASNQQRIEFPGNNGGIYLGYKAGASTTNGINIAIGDSALLSMTAGTNNIALGRKALSANTSSLFNIALGQQSLNLNTASFNVAAGSLAMRSNVAGTRNTAFGFKSLHANTNGNENVAFGATSLMNNTVGNYNTAVGFGTLFSNTTGDNNTASGKFALQYNTIADDNTALGFESINKNITGIQLTAAGYQSLLNSISLSGVTATGAFALKDLTTGIGNTAFGSQSLGKTTTGEFNTAFGASALYNNIAGNRNTAIGSDALLLNTESRNTAVGYNALRNNSTGINNTAMGFEAMITNTTGSENTTIGYNAAVSANNLVNATAIGAHSIVSSSNALILGSSITTPRVGIGISNPHTKAILDLTSTTRGLLLPRLSQAAINDMNGEPAGLLLYNNAMKSLYFFDNANGGWTNANNAFNQTNGDIGGMIPVRQGLQWNLDYTDVLEDTDGDSKMQIEKNFNENIFRIRLGGVERLVIRRNVLLQTMIEVKAEYNCLFLGQNAGETSASGQNNTGIGYSVLRQLTAAGQRNTAFGSNVLENNTSGSSNTAVGYLAMNANISGSENVAVGYNALENFTSGDNNVAIGLNTLNALAVQNSNTAIGSNAEASGSATSNATAIGPKARVTTSNSLVLGAIEGINGATVNTKVGIGTPTPNARFHILKNNTNPVQPHLLIDEDDNDFGRIKFRNNITTEEWGMVGKPTLIVADARFNFFYGQNILSLEGDGDAVLTGTLTQNSDARLKKNILSLSFTWCDLMKLQAYTYHWIDTLRNKDQQIGLIAQEMEMVYPPLVNEDEEGIKSINYLGLTPVLIEGVKSSYTDLQQTQQSIHQINDDLELLKSSLDTIKSDAEKAHHISEDSRSPKNEKR